MDQRKLTRIIDELTRRRDLLRSTIQNLEKLLETAVSNAAPVKPPKIEVKEKITRGSSSAE